MYNNVFINTCLIKMVKVLSACSDNVEGKLWCSDRALVWHANGLDSRIASKLVAVSDSNIITICLQPERRGVWDCLMWLLTTSPFIVSSPII